MWKEYPHDNRYLVSDDGVIRGARGWYLKPAPVTGGYLTVNIAGKTRKVAHVVAETWIGPRPEGHVVAHLDGNNQNNVSWNLAYVTPSENERHKESHGTSNRGEGNGRSKLTARDVENIRKFLNAGISQTSLAKCYGVTQSLISQIKRGVAW